MVVLCRTACQFHSILCLCSDYCWDFVLFYFCCICRVAVMINSQMCTHYFHCMFFGQRAFFLSLLRFFYFFFRFVRANMHRMDMNGLFDCGTQRYTHTQTRNTSSHATQTTKCTHILSKHETLFNTNTVLIAPIYKCCVLFSLLSKMRI